MKDEPGIGVLGMTVLVEEGSEACSPATFSCACLPPLPTSFCCQGD